MRSMRNDLTKTAQAAREPEMVQNKVLKASETKVFERKRAAVYVYENFPLKGGKKRRKSGGSFVKQPTFTTS